MAARRTFGAKALDCAFSLLNNEGLLHIKGPDSLTFLQGQTTCDTREAGPEQAVPGVYCTPKGRTVADFLLVTLSDDQFALRMRRDVVAAAAEVLGKYIIFSKAELEPSDDGWQIAACWGDDAATLLRSIFTELPEGKYGAVSGKDFHLVQIDDQGKQFECYFSTGCELTNQLTRDCNPGDQGDWEALQIAAGIARIESATVEEFIPQTLNYDLTGFISFTKGCYTGQEVVARLHYRGKSKRRGYAGTLTASQPPAAGTPLFASGGDKAVGNVVNACRDSEGVIWVMASATADGASSGLHLEDSSGPQMTLTDLPYSIADPDAD
jgi:tRNA-modifying protein YgfZ